MTQRAIKLPTAECRRCGHKWVPSVPQPKTCPRCKSYEWATPKAAKQVTSDVTATEAAATDSK